MTIGTPIEPLTSDRDNSEVHLLPCKIHFNGRSPVNLYFQQVPIESEDKVKDQNNSDKVSPTNTISMASQFRGRQLKGRKYSSLKSTHEISGVVLKNCTDKLCTEGR